MSKCSHSFTLDYLSSRILGALAFNCGREASWNRRQVHFVVWKIHLNFLFFNTFPIDPIRNRIQIRFRIGYEQLPAFHAKKPCVSVFLYEV